MNTDLEDLQQLIDGAEIDVESARMEVRRLEARLAEATSLVRKRTAARDAIAAALQGSMKPRAA